MSSVSLLGEIERLSFKQEVALVVLICFGGSWAVGTAMGNSWRTIVGSALMGLAAYAVIELYQLRTTEVTVGDE